MCIHYQLALRTPGISPLLARFLKQIRQIWNFLYTARDRPQSWQRRITRVLNFGGLLALLINAVLATVPPLPRF
jgi:hypothetical protein